VIFVEELSFALVIVLNLKGAERAFVIIVIKLMKTGKENAIN
jgi:hypothetical protein